METKTARRMIASGLIAFAVGLALMFLLQNTSMGFIAFIVAAVGAGIALRGLFTQVAGDGPGGKLIYWGWCGLAAGAILLILLPAIGIAALAVAAVALIAGHTVRSNKSHSGAV